MKDGKFLYEDQQLASRLRSEVLRLSENEVKPALQKEIAEMELISETQKPYVSPLFTMNEDEILAFVEEFDVNELATLSVAELNRIGEVLGVDPTILANVEEI